jgi:hypothetical protein
MANYIFRHEFTRFGRRWRLDIITADETYAAPTTVVELPYNVIVDEPMEWSCGFDHIPIGLPDAPTLKMAFDMSAMEASAELQHLHDRLLNPYIKPAPAAIATIEHEATVIYTGVGTIEIPAYTETVFESADNVPLLTNVVALYSDRGNSALAANELQLEAVFAQGLSTEPTEWDVEKQVLVVEFSDIWKFTLEQVATSTIAAKIREVATIRTNQLYNHVWTAPSGKFWIEAQVEDIDEDPAIMLYGAVNIFERIKDQATTLVYRITRTLLGGMAELDAAYLPYCKFFYQNPNATNYPDKGVAIVNPLELVTPLSIGAASETQDTYTAGGLANTGGFIEAETAFDFVFDQYEGGVIGRYTNSGIKAYRLAGRGAEIKSTHILKATNIEVTKLSIGKNLIRASEVTADNTQPIRSKSAGQTKGQKDLSANLTFHNHAYSADKLEQSTLDFFRGYTFKEGKLYYQEGSFAGGEPTPYVAVMPVVEFEVSKNTFFSFPFIPDIFPAWIAATTGAGGAPALLDGEDASKALADYANSVNGTNGIARVIGAAITAFYSEYNSVTLDFKAHIQDLPVDFASVGELMPNRVAFRHEIDWTGIVSARMASKLPNFGALLKSSFDLKTGIITGTMLFTSDPSDIVISPTTDLK